MMHRTLSGVHSLPVPHDFDDKIKAHILLMLFPACESKNKLQTVCRMRLILVPVAWTLQSINMYLEIRDIIIYLLIALLLTHLE